MFEHEEDCRCIDLFDECFKNGDCKYCHYRKHPGIEHDYDHKDTWDFTFKPLDLIKKLDEKKKKKVKR